MYNYVSLQVYEQFHETFLRRMNAGVSKNNLNPLPSPDSLQIIIQGKMCSSKFAVFSTSAPGVQKELKECQYIKAC
jgi:hypothetical protein